MKKKTSKKISNVGLRISKNKTTRLFFKKKEKRPVHKKKEHKTSQFPRILRIFTERYFFASLIIIVLVAAIGILGVKLNKDINQKQEVDKERQEIIKEVEFWKTVVTKYKDYRDAYFQLAILEYRLGDFRASKFYLQKTFELDPNFDKGRELEKILNKK